MLNIKKTLTQLIKHVPTYNSVTAWNYMATSTNWEYTGKSFTVPTNHVWLVNVRGAFSSGRPIGMGVHNANTVTASGPVWCISSPDTSTSVNWTPTFLLQAGTYYVFCKRASVPTATNQHMMNYIDIPL